ncbi:phosphodiesterase [Pendulispora rubella]|uniref:Phosphodiesterase n=1 Tax=Pendulispora rubella TaxID=2741070 RepID=A0ABZ2KXQ9_9BACT
MLLAQISDLHIGAVGSSMDVHAHTAEHLVRAVEHLNRLDPSPDAVLCTGDLVDAGSAEEYARLAELLAPLKAPYYLVAGNHDHRDNLRAAFAHHGYFPAEGYLQYVVDLGPVRVVALDTNVPGAPGGLLCEERLAWLDARLAEEPSRPTLVMQHHPPFLTGMQQMDTMILDGMEAMANVVRKHPQVERIVCGHLHRPITRRVGGTLAMTCPSTAHQVELDLRERGRLAVITEPPACLLHAWSEGLGLVSHTSYIGDFGTPYVIIAEESAPGQAVQM